MESYLEGYTYRLFTPFSEETVQEARRIYDHLSNLKPEVADWLEIPIDRWIQSLSGHIPGKEPKNSIIDLGIALESFYLSDKDNRSELSYRLCLRAALYLSSNTDERESLREDFKKMYKWRSDIVHKWELHKEFSHNDLEKYQGLFRDSLLKAIEENKMPDWPALELDSGVKTEETQD